MSLQDREQKLLATIIACKKVVYGGNGSEMDIKLFESVTGLYGGVTNQMIEENNEVKFSDFQKLGDNKFAYFKKVSSLVFQQENENIIRPLNEDLIFDNFKSELDKLIKELESNNDFNKLDLLDKEILGIKIFAKSPISVLGFDIMNTIKSLNTENDLLGVFSVMYNKSTKEIYFIRKGEVLIYCLKTNEYKTLINEKLSATNYTRVISSEVNANVVEIYSDIKLTIPTIADGFKDNLFGDVRRTKELYDYKKETSFLKEK